MPARRLYRSRTERKIAGVCGGIAEHFDVDPVWVRLGAVALTLLPVPFVPIAYLVCWLIVPNRPLDETAPLGSSAPQAEGGAGDAAAEASAATPSTEPWGAGSGARQERDGTVIGGAIFIGLGLFFLLLNFGVLDWGLFRYWRWRYLWPIALIFLGGFMVARSIGAPRRAARR